MAYWLRKTEKDQYDALGELLGVRFHRDDFIKRAGQQKPKQEPTDEVMVGLSFLLGTDVHKTVKNIFRKTPSVSTGKSSLPKGVQNMGDLSLEEWMQLRKQLGDPVRFDPDPEKARPGKRPKKRKKQEKPLEVPNDVLEMLTGRSPTT